MTGSGIGGRYIAAQRGAFDAPPLEAPITLVLPPESEARVRTCDASGVPGWQMRKKAVAAILSGAATLRSDGMVVYGSRR